MTDFMKIIKKAVGEVQNEKGPAILLPDDAKNKKYLQLTGELFKNSNFAHGKHPVCLDKSA